jgi:hypothetical protein
MAGPGGAVGADGGAAAGTTLKADAVPSSNASLAELLAVGGWTPGGRIRSLPTLSPTLGILVSLIETPAPPSTTPPCSASS